MQFARQLGYLIANWWLHLLCIHWTVYLPEQHFKTNRPIIFHLCTNARYFIVILMSCEWYLPDEEPHTLASITTLMSSRLADFIEPDFGLLDHLLSLQVLDLRQLADVRSERTVYRRNDALLDLLTSEDQCGKFLTALRQTGQHHVVNFIKQNGGQKHMASVKY